MSESKHSPGPWRTDYQARKGVDDLIEICGDNNEIGARPIACVIGEWPDPEVEADARLIAAAPDLLEAVKEALPCMPTSCDVEPEGNLVMYSDAEWYRVVEATKKLRAAIAKARGQA